MNQEFVRKLFLEKFPSLNKHYLNRYIRVLYSSKSCEETVEKHHILPKSIWPEYRRTKSNYKYLSLKAHFLVHWILAKMLPNNEEMTYAFYYMCNRNENKHKFVKEFSKLRETVLLRLRKINDDRLEAGTHNFQGKNNPSHKRVNEGTHNLQGKRNPVHKRVADGSLSEWSKLLNKNRIDDNIHQFQGSRSPIHKMIAEGRHPSQTIEFKKLISDMNKKRVQKGTHSLAGAKPWTHYGATDVTINTWRKAGTLKNLSKQNPGFRYKKLFALLSSTYEDEIFSLPSVKRMVKWFDDGWSPEKDEKWLEFFEKGVDRP